jgi:hypothetical protein
VIDCGADPDPSFGDIGDAVRRCRVDFGAEITLDVTRFRRDENGQAASHYVVGSIVFSEPHARSLRWGEALAPAQRSGIIVWVKPSRRPNDPADVIQYGLDNAVFPQQSTGDQWYTEAQFESYRRLGFRSAEDALEGVPAFGDQARVDAWQVFARIEANFAPPAAQANAPAGPMRP